MSDRSHSEVQWELNGLRSDRDELMMQIEGHQAELEGFHSQLSMVMESIASAEDELSDIEAAEDDDEEEERY